ncbi:hypothetical protein ACFE04_031595 [Oxalis oulophora]
MDLYTIFLLMCMFAIGSARSVEEFGAVGDGITDDTNAFLKTWDAICNGVQTIPTLEFPAGKTFLMNPITFSGPCKPKTITVLINGNLVATTNFEAYNVTGRDRWISFYNVNGLRVYGTGQLDGRGKVWWTACPEGRCPRPSILAFIGCNNLLVKGLRTLNSPRNHISIVGVRKALFSSLHLKAPGDSVNTDGIVMYDATNVRIEDSTIETGDDCIGITSKVTTLNITRVNCGPGHGISVGSLGGGGEIALVDGVYVSHCNFTGTLNAVRIKTFPGGGGYAKNIWFTDIELHDSDNPIFIDQFYPKFFLDGPDVKISDVHFTRIKGTSIRETAINLQCSRALGCHGIYLTDINITPSKKNPPRSKLTAICSNAHGKALRTSPAATCLLP